MAKQEVAGHRLAVEEREPVAARLGRLEQLSIVVEVKGAAHVSPAP